MLCFCLFNTSAHGDSLTPYYQPGVARTGSNPQITSFETFGSRLPIRQIVVDLHQYSSASESQLPFRSPSGHLPSRQSGDPAVEDLLFDSAQLSGLQNISVIKSGSRTFNQSIISLTIHTAAQGILIRRLGRKRNRIADRIHLLDVDAWVNAKLQWQRSEADNRLKAC